VPPNGLHPREFAIVEEIAQALKEMGGEFVLPFRFRDDAGKRTSHHLIFVSKHFRGYEIMKEIMAKESTSADQGVPSFEYNPSDKRYRLLFELSRPLDDLEDMLLEHFAGRQSTMRQIYEEHNVDRPFIAKNYKNALHNLETAGKISLAPGTKRRGTTFADHLSVSFPGQGS